MEIDPAKIDPKHLKVSFLPLKEEMSRRDLLLALLKPHYEIVPAVEEDRCVAWRGCSLCVASCPQGAIFLKEGSASIDKDKCTACGACLPACPEEAISSPLLGPEVLDGSLDSLLCRDERNLEPRAILVTSEDVGALLTTERGSLPPQLVELKLPCIGALSPWLLLRSFDLGSDGVVLIPCGSTCRHHCQPERWQRIIRFVQALLVKLGVEPERLRVFPFCREGPQSLAELLQAFVEELKKIGPSRLCNGNRKEKHLNLVALLEDLRRFNIDGSGLSGDEIPFGIVRVETGNRTCTLCGVCQERCPTGAITLQEGAELSQLLFDHGRCIACQACVGVCPERVLRMEKTLDFPHLGQTVVLAEERMAHCRRCGKEIASLSMIRKIRDQIARSNAVSLSGLSEFCPDCRIFASFGQK